MEIKVFFPINLEYFIISLRKKAHAENLKVDLRKVVEIFEIFSLKKSIEAL